MVDLLDEVMEDVKQERWQRLMQKYGSLIVWFIVFVLFTVGAVTWVKQSRREAAEASGDVYYDAQPLLAQNQLESARTLLDTLEENGSEGFEELAALQLAAIDLREGKREEAKARYAEVSEESGAPETLKDMATLMHAKLSLEDGAVDGALTALTPLTEPGRPWRYSALELKAIAEYTKGETEKAIQILASIRDDGGAPRAARDRASLLIEYWQKS